MSAEYTKDDASHLPRGRHRLTRGAVVEHQRQRLIRAVPAVVCTKGFGALTVEDISARAGVSRRTFYENFVDKEDCFLTSYRQHAQELMAVIAGAASAGEDWQERARLGLVALLRFLAERPELAHMAVIDVMAAGPAALAIRDETVSSLASLLGDEALAAYPNQVPGLLLQTISGAILQLVYAWVLTGRGADLEELVPTIIYLVLVPLHGPAGAASESGLLAASTAPG